ncbi:MAG: hypothetical protein AAGU14_10835 [Eubacteriaceae bacterium]
MFIAQRCAFLITDMGAEGVEETLQTAVDPLIRNTVFKENNNLVLSGKDYLESFLVGALSVGALHSASVAKGINNDIKSFNAKVNSPDGKALPADTANRLINGKATSKDIEVIRDFGKGITQKELNDSLTKMDNVANVKLGTKTYSQINKETAGMSAYDKISYFSDIMSSPEFKAHTEELVKTAQEQKAKAENINKSEAADVSDVKQNAETGILNNTKNSIQEVNTDEVNNTDNTLDKTVSNINESTSKEDVLNSEPLSSSQNNSIDTDNGLKENYQSNDNAGKNISNVNSDGSYGKVNTNSSQGIANSDEMGYKGGEWKIKAFSDMSYDEAMQIAKEYAKKSPIQIPETANIKTSTMKNGYEQIKYKWADDVYKYEVRWHTKTPNAPTEQGNTWVIMREIPGSKTQRSRSYFKVDNSGADSDWVSGHEWYRAITARQNGTATQEQIEILNKGHWKE